MEVGSSREEIRGKVPLPVVALLVGAQLGKDPTEMKMGTASQTGVPSVIKYGRLIWLDACSPADPLAPPGPLTHLSLPDSSEARPHSGADGRSLSGNWTR